MLLNERFRKSVVFLCAGHRRRPAATGFLVHVPLTDDPVAGSALYVVTANHVIEQSRQYGTLYLRVNIKDGGYQDIAADQDQWLVDGGADVAVAPVAYEPEMDVIATGLERLATDEMATEEEFEVGDAVFFVGLFSEHAGRKKIVPVARFGKHLAPASY